MKLSVPEPVRVVTRRRFCSVLGCRARNFSSCGEGVLHLSLGHWAQCIPAE